MGGVPGVEILRHGLRRKHPDIRRQMLVERQRQLLWRDAGIGMEIQPEAQRVHPGIGATAAGNAHPLTAQQGELFFQYTFVLPQNQLLYMLTNYLNY